MNVDIVSGIGDGNIKSSLSKMKIRHVMVLTSDPLRMDSSYTLHIDDTWHVQLLPLFRPLLRKVLLPPSKYAYASLTPFFVSSL